jgi:hypothetical protein
MAGRNLERVDLLRAKAELPSVRSEFDLRLFFLALESVAAADHAETDLLHTYVAIFGEVPPMNAQASWLEIR